MDAAPKPLLDTKQPDHDQEVGLFASAGDALRAVSDSYDYWSGNLTTSSLQMNYALIGANWIIFGSVNGILSNKWSKWSMILVFLALLTNVIGSLVLTALLRSRILEAEGDNPKWQQEFAAAQGKATHWPFTPSIDNTGTIMRSVKAGLTIASGICLIVGALIGPIAPPKP